MNYTKIKLLGGAEVNVDFDSYKTLCKKCGKPIRFAITSLGKSMPITETEKGWQSHFADCKFAASFRKSKTDEQIEDENKNQEFLNNL